VQERRALVPAVVALVVLAVDHLTKWWAINELDDRDIDLIGSLRLNLVFNRGASFGLGSRYAPFIALIAVVVVFVLLRTGRHETGTWPRVALALVTAGAVGNLLDRLFRSGDGFLGGAVVDFIDVQWWPVWNVADMAISIGAVLLVLTAARESTDAEASA
jgi:signal peptidase II